MGEFDGSKVGWFEGEEEGIIEGIVLGLFIGSNELDGAFVGEIVP